MKKFEPVEWNEEMSVGHEDIDNDHRKLLSLINELNYILTADVASKNGAIASVLSELIDYTAYHFQREEDIMEACNYPELQSHRQAHEVFKGQVNSFMDGFKNRYQSFDPMALRFFLQDWLVEHILKMDKQYESWLQNK